MPRDCRLKHWFRSETPIQTATAHNTHGHHGRRQWGGTGILAFGEAAAARVSSGKDESGLGRWSWILFQGANDHKTRVISAYRPCRSDKCKMRTVYNQHRRYFRSIQRPGCPRRLFVQDLQEQLVTWRNAGERIILCIDGNEDVRNGALKDALSIPELGMTELISGHHPDLPVTASFVSGERRGSVQIDGVWATPDLPPDRATWLAFHKAPGDHRYGVVDIKWDVILGEPRYKAVRPTARRLTGNHFTARKNYNKKLKRLFLQHKLLPKYHTIYAASRECTEHTPAHQRILETTDKVKHELMISSEKTCRKMAMGTVDFSPAVNKAKKIMALWQLVTAK